MIRKCFYAIFALVLIVVLAGCSSGQGSDVKLDKQSNGKQITLKQGQALSIQLESNITTGYSWTIDNVDEAVLKSQGEPEYVEAQPGKQLTGGGGWQTFHFQPGKTGQTNLKLIYHRPWEKDVEPIQIYEVQVTVE